MSGSNGIPKFPKVNREDELIDLKYRGVVYRQVDNLLITSNSIRGAQALQNLVFDSTTPNAITAPTNAQILDALNKNYLTTPGSVYQAVYENLDPTNAKVITFPGLGSVTIPPNSSTQIGIKVTGQNPATLAFFSPSSSPNDATVLNGTTLVDPAGWQNNNGYNPTVTKFDSIPVWSSTSNSYIPSETVPLTEAIRVRNVRLEGNLFYLAPATYDVIGMQEYRIFGDFKNPPVDANQTIPYIRHLYSMGPNSNVDTIRQDLSIYSIWADLGNMSTAPAFGSQVMRYLSCYNRTLNSSPLGTFNETHALLFNGEARHTGSITTYGNVNYVGSLNNIPSTLSTKKNIVDLNQYLSTDLTAKSAINMVKNISPITFNYKTDPDGTSLRWGFLADPLDTLGGKYKDLLAYDPTDPSKFIGVKRDFFDLILFQAVKELIARVDKINALSTNNVTYDV